MPSYVIRCISLLRRCAGYQFRRQGDGGGGLAVDDLQEEVDRFGADSCEGFIDAELLEDMLLNRDADYYFCGPKPFRVGIYHNLLKWGIPASQVHFEFFGSRQELSLCDDAQRFVYQRNLEVLNVTSPIHIVGIDSASGGNTIQLSKGCSSPLQ